MTKAKLEKAIYYIGEDSELGTAEKLRENLVQHSKLTKEQVPLLQFGATGQEVPEELILMAHSDDTRTTIGDKTPRELARDLVKQFAGKDKTQLKSIKLVSCEGGFGDRPLALELAKELFKQGFTQAVVKSATHPKESKIGGVVSVTTHAGISRMAGNEDGKATAVMYGNQKTVDYIHYKELRGLFLRRNRHPELWNENKAKEMELLAQKHSNFEGFDEKHPDYCVIQLIGDINDLDAPQHCYTKDGVQAQFSLDSVIALEALRLERFAAYNIADNKKLGAYIDKLITQINQNPSIEKSEIIDLLNNKELSKGISSKTIKILQENITNAIDQKRNAMDPNARPSKAATIASKFEDAEVYLERLLKKDGVFDKLWRSIYGVGEFTRSLRLAVIRVSTQTLGMKVEREGIIGQIEAQFLKDASKLSIEKSRFLGLGKKTSEETALKVLYDELKTYCAKPNPTPQDWRSVQVAKGNYDNNQSRDHKSPQLEALIAQLAANNQKYNDIGKNIQQLEARVDEVIQTYLTKYDKGDETDNTHKPKVAVMKAMQEYVNKPSEENWKKLEQSTEKNEGWDKGMFSKVRFMMSETRKVREEQKQLEQDLSPPAPKL